MIAATTGIYPSPPLPAPTHPSIDGQTDGPMGKHVSTHPFPNQSSYPLSIHLSTPPLLHPSFLPSTHPPILLSFHPPTYPSIIHSSIHPPNSNLSTYPSLPPFTHPSIYPSVHPSVPPSMCAVGQHRQVNTLRLQHAFLYHPWASGVFPQNKLSPTMGRPRRRAEPPEECHCLTTQPSARPRERLTSDPGSVSSSSPPSARGAGSRRTPRGSHSRAGEKTGADTAASPVSRAVLKPHLLTGPCTRTFVSETKPALKLRSFPYTAQSKSTGTQIH